jgi:hypothetical protein
MLSEDHKAALGDSRQFQLGSALMDRLSLASNMMERIGVLMDAETQFGLDDTREHAIRVAEMARSLALHVGFDKEYAQKLHFAARWHDIGKLFTPDDILNKPGALTAYERTLINNHAAHGGDLLGPNAPQFYTNVARYHHEQYCGHGYDKLVGESIPMEARLVQIADVFDAMHSSRAYKIGRSKEDTLKFMVDKQKTRVEFDPFLLRRFVSMHLEQDHDNAIGPETRVELAAFVASQPKTDIAALPDPAVLDGWEISPEGKRRHYYTDAVTGNRKLGELRSAVGEVMFKVDGHSPAASNDQAETMDIAPPSPRF